MGRPRKRERAGTPSGGRFALTVRSEPVDGGLTAGHLRSMEYDDIPPDPWTQFAHSKTESPQPPPDVRQQPVSLPYTDTDDIPPDPWTQFERSKADSQQPPPDAR